MKNECSMAKKIESFKKNEKSAGKSGMWFDFYDSEKDANDAADGWNKAHPKNKKPAHVTPWTSADGKEQKWICQTYESCKNSESLKNEANGDVIYTLRSANCDVYEDSYEEGEGRHVNAFDMDSTVVGKQFSNISDMIAFLGDKVIYDDAYTKGDNWLAFEYEDGELRLDTDVMVDADNNSIGMDYNLDAWKAGKETLYNAHWMVFVSVAYKSDVPSEIVASAVKEAGLECDF